MKITTKSNTEKPTITKPMNELEPGEIGVIIDGMYEGHYVQRSVNSDSSTVYDLSVICVDSCWDDTSSRKWKVRSMYCGETFTVIFEG